MSSNLPPTPLPEPRPFERLADSAVDLPKACRFWIPATAGVIFWPLVGPVVALLAVLGAWWRGIAILQASRASPDLAGCLTFRLWGCGALAVAAFGAVAVTEVVAGSFLGVRVAPWLLGWWWLATLGEIVMAVLWVAREALRRESRWVLLPLAGALTTLAVAAGLQLLAAAQPDLLSGRRLVVVATIAATALTGVIGPLLIADGIGRVLGSETEEAFERESA